MMQFKNLRSMREDRDLKQKDIAKILTMSQNTYSQYETGVISLTAEVNHLGVLLFLLQGFLFPAFAKNDLAVYAVANKGGARKTAFFALYRGSRYVSFYREPVACCYVSLNVIPAGDGKTGGAAAIQVVADA